jgi:hypothetical protein
VQEVRDGNGGDNQKNCHHNQQLNERETFVCIAHLTLVSTGTGLLKSIKSAGDSHAPLFIPFQRSQPNLRYGYF